jgi:osmotically inducible lipoprotein OsmB
MPLNSPEGYMISRTLISLIGAVTLAAGLSACSSSPTRQQVGVGTGAVVGGVAGNVLTGGSTLGTVGGAAVGGVVGNEVTKPK